MCVLSKYCPHLDPKHVGIFFFVFFYSVYFICLCGFSQKQWIYIINLILEVIEKALLVIQSFQISLANWWNMTFVLFFKLKFLILVQKTWIQHIFFLLLASLCKKTLFSTLMKRKTWGPFLFRACYVGNAVGDAFQNPARHLRWNVLRK